MSDSIAELAEFVRRGFVDDDLDARGRLEALFGERYHKRHFGKNDKNALRDALKLGIGEGADDAVPFAGLIHPDNPESGPYGGSSVVWFPTRESGSLVILVVGTRGLSPDEGILTRPGHRRRVAALRRLLASKGVEVWSKPDPANVGIPVPKSAKERFPGFENAFKRYGQQIYCMALVRREAEPRTAREVVQAFFDLYSYERGWEPLSAHREERDRFLGSLRQDLFPKVTEKGVHDLLKARHFVILEGPPGTGKTLLAGKVLKNHFGGNGMIVQFHPAVTYEDFVVGLSPDIGKGETLRFEVRAGWLYEAAKKAAAAPYLLIIDEINRADLGKVLGEGIHLFEPGEVGGRTVALAHPVNGQKTLTLPQNLYVLGTMNTADRSIASIDLAIRRRFSFVKVMPDREVVARKNNNLATELYDRTCDVFVEHAPEEALNLMPGHSYFLADDENELRTRLRHELIPLLDEYLREGYLGPATTELHAVRDAMEDAAR